MVTQVLLLIVGLALVVFGADWLVDGSSSIARKAGISEFVIGLTIVGFGTSCPELVVSLTGAFQGNADISIGNVVGSNLMNTLFILGLTAALAPIAISRENARRDIPITLGVTVMMLLCGLNSTLLKLGQSDSLTRVEGLVFLAVFAAYMYYCFKFDTGTSDEIPEKTYGLPAACGLVLLGLCGLIVGGRLFVDNAVSLAHALGVSDKFIAVTILAGGTSLPELATCLVAVAKKKDQLALGNILGSNVFNILLILGCSAAVTPLSFSGINLVDAGVLLLSALLVMMCSFTGRRDRVDRWEGVLMVICYVAYMVWLFKKL